MLKEKRIQQIYELIKRDGQVEISELGKMCNVTEMTIRRDLESLSEMYHIVRTHGGAMLPTGEESTELPYERRVVSQEAQKKRIAMKALSFVKNGQTIFLDSGSTTYFMAENIDNGKDNIVITNGLNLASEMLKRQKLSVVLIGGNLRRNTLSAAGPLAEQQISQFRVEIAFLGGNGLGQDGHVYIGNVAELGIKRAIMKIARKKYLLADSSKYGHESLLHYASVDEFDGIIIDSELPEEKVRELKDLGANVIIV